MVIALHSIVVDHTWLNRMNYCFIRLPKEPETLKGSGSVGCLLKPKRGVSRN